MVPPAFLAQPGRAAPSTNSENDGGSMRIVITGGAGFIGKKLAKALLHRGPLATAAGKQPIDSLVLFDVVHAEGLPDDRRIVPVAGDITDANQVRRLIT